MSSFWLTLGEISYFLYVSVSTCETELQHLTQLVIVREATHVRLAFFLPSSHGTLHFSSIAHFTICNSVIVKSVLSCLSPLPSAGRYTSWGKEPHLSYLPCCLLHSWVNANWRKPEQYVSCPTLLSSLASLVSHTQEPDSFFWLCSSVSFGNFCASLMVFLAFACL